MGRHRALHGNTGKLHAICFDVYASPETDFIADAHHIPLPDASVNGVWIQAVLEHVIQPERVVAEIHRVLKPRGIVYADIPFMQTVHEGAYDFTRFTDTGIRWLFRWFDRMESGVSLGPGRTLLWSIETALGGLFRSYRVGTAIGTLLFFWVRLINYFIPRSFAIDGACGLYFFGRKAAKPVSPKDVIRVSKEFLADDCDRTEPPRRTSCTSPDRHARRRFSTLEEITPYADDWERLAADVPFRGWTWLSNWWRNYGPESGGDARRIRLAVLGVFDDAGELRALPLGISTARRSTAGAPPAGLRRRLFRISERAVRSGCWKRRL